VLREVLALVGVVDLGEHDDARARVERGEDPRHRGQTGVVGDQEVPVGVGRR